LQPTWESISPFLKQTLSKPSGRFPLLFASGNSLLPLTLISHSVLLPIPLQSDSVAALNYRPLHDGIPSAKLPALLFSAAVKVPFRCFFASSLILAIFSGVIRFSPLQINNTENRRQTILAAVFWIWK